ncbi:MBL fold metallo-hydrolase [Pedobacter sp. Leaf132]|uniref:MBL fold metallo-hydrolase n=1 Tax=Pedobacter sp. Leaf132 TaxID=2876557 RepID=UPI001E56A65F|nr:MBL fold metallo-hydrolase [Pedobacter sp. Leaf132]
MNLHVIGTGSKGNAYIIQNDDEALLIECGVKFSESLKALNFNTRKVAGMLISHSHLDHCKHVKDVIKAGIDVFCLKETSDTFGISNHRINHVLPGKTFMVGSFKVAAFDLKHDVPCLGFIVEHSSTGRFCFITDSYYCEYKLPAMNNMIVEANYCDTILKARLDAGEEPSFLRDRVIRSHMSLQTCKQLLQANDLKNVFNIVLIHLSDRNSHALRFQKEIKDLTAKKVTVAENGTVIAFGKTPF